jgi:hypothetical protein
VPPFPEVVRRADVQVGLGTCRPALPHCVSLEMGRSGTHGMAFRFQAPEVLMGLGPSRRVIRRQRPVGLPGLTNPNPPCQAPRWRSSRGLRQIECLRRQAGHFIASLPAARVAS